MTSSTPADGLVWHYTDAAGLLSITSNHVLWATASGFLNDALEVELGVTRMKEALEVKAAGSDDVVRRFIEERLRSELMKPSTASPTLFFILSAAQHWDLLAMWRCYGGRGESYAIGLDPHAPLAVLTEPGVDVSPLTTGDGYVTHRPWAPVRYDLAEQRALAEAVVEGLPAAYEAARARVASGELDRADVLEAVQGTLDDLEQALFLIKHSGFHDEREVRYCTGIFDPDGSAYRQGVVRYRASAFGMAPYLHLTGAGEPGSVFTDRAAPLPIRAVAISPSPHGGRSAEPTRAMLAGNGYDVDVFASQIPFRA
ncbi:hypothetical protein BJY21_001226 [Kineosphaera limosa]|uniref:DUF2971 domain-containing protein n=1 Tax=Kineosphaera limosa NBRC 100340 TaxID=1184609 RepID=K6VHW7_9MICO|nr:DUF2971 domain-containing protein [Kineosphaera limosa]NYE00042.1 hypothetical protein [Kineosphaera limosa]GAB95783.1 hypothetical protein KILIM_026_00540 [Kineosphaera limosa NBRC 100340]